MGALARQPTRWSGDACAHPLARAQTRAAKRGRPRDRWQRRVSPHWARRCRIVDISFDNCCKRGITNTQDVENLPSQTVYSGVNVRGDPYSTGILSRDDLSQSHPRYVGTPCHAHGPPHSQEQWTVDARRSTAAVCGCHTPPPTLQHDVAAANGTGAALAPLRSGCRRGRRLVRRWDRRLVSRLCRGSRRGAP